MINDIGLDDLLGPKKIRNTEQDIVPIEEFADQAEEGKEMPENEHQCFDTDSEAERDSFLHKAKGESAALAHMKTVMKKKSADGTPYVKELMLGSYELQSLEFLAQPKFHVWTNLEELDISRNLLASIYPL